MKIAFPLVALLVLGLALQACGQRVYPTTPAGKVNPSREY